jgi:hypothetical protein
MLAGMAFEGSPFLRQPGEFWMNLGVFLLLCCCLGGGGGQDEKHQIRPAASAGFIQPKMKQHQIRPEYWYSTFGDATEEHFFFRSNEGLLHSLFVQKIMQYCCMIWFRLKKRL